jgi:hypothetical protein
MDASTLSQQAEVIELAVEEIEVVSGGFPIVPPVRPGG